MKSASLLAVLALLFSAVPSQARPAYKRALVDLLELAAVSRLNDCTVCHQPAKANSEERPHNAFGKKLKEMRAVLRKANKPYDIVSRILAIADQDADGDGTANLAELLAGTFPGDATDKPTAAQVTAARKRQAALLVSLTGYRWKPFERVAKPSLPAVKAGERMNNPIDRFLAARREKLGLAPRAEAPRTVLLRRVTIDLTGLPPTPEEVTSFLDDKRPGAYGRVVDRLLSSPAYGERWGRHWMDVWRYSDWAGFGAQVRDSQPHVWHWRDWIVESLNEGKGYNRMVQEMLAGDELAPSDTRTLRATGFLVRNYKLLSREKWLQDVVDHTGQAFLGLTLGCARCHDHMYDPITQKEYYQFRALFTPHQVRTDRLPGFFDTRVNGLPRAYDANPAAPTFLFVRGDDRNPEKTPLQPNVPESLGGTFAIKPVDLPREAYMPDHHPAIIKDILANSAAKVKLAEQRLIPSRLAVTRAAVTLLAGTGWKMLPALAAIRRTEDGLELAEIDTRIAAKQDQILRLQIEAEKQDQAKAGSEEWKKAAMAALVAQRELVILTARRQVLALEQQWRLTLNRAPLTLPLNKAKAALAQAEATLKLPAATAYARRPVATYPKTSSGRRLALAKWLTSRDNPLAARVAVNHVWTRHFGRGLVPNVFDFGRNGQAPTHPELLDWLAVEFMEQGWNLKDLHRQIVTSAAYRADSRPDKDSLAKDPDNVYLWRFTPRRTEAEVVRDSIFFVADRLDQRLGGADIPHQQGLTVPRRSLYFQHAQEKQMEFLLLFDTASVVECYERKHAIVPQQALALINSDLVWQHARLTARLLHAKTRDEGAFTDAAFLRVLSRLPTKEERHTCVLFLKAQAAKFAASKPKVVPPDAAGRIPATDPGLRARENLVQVLMNHHEFVTLR